MLDCLILGDSIAVGVGQARPDCIVEAVAGISSDRFVQTLPGAPAARAVVISLGVNDGDAADTLGNLRRLRSRITAETVYWLLPGANPRAQDAIRMVAAQYGDRLVDTKPLVGADGIHPDRAGYALLARQTQQLDPGHPVGSQYRDFPAAEQVYRAFPGVTVWSGPYSANGHYVPGQSRPNQ